jgi:hypothetical protein
MAWTKDVFAGVGLVVMMGAAFLLPSLTQGMLG